MSQADSLSRRYAATAFVRGSTGLWRALATERSNLMPLLAQSPLAAARSWYWRLSTDERAGCLRIVVGPWDEPETSYFPVYTGPAHAFSPAEGWRLIEPIRTAELALSE